MPGSPARTRVAWSVLAAVACCALAHAAGGAQPALGEPLVVHSFKRPAGETPRRVALTFDDGPNATYTPQLLEILARHGARATFFVLGAAASNSKQLIQRMSEAGHEIGIHTWSHRDLTKLSNEAIRADLARCQALLGPLVQDGIHWVRPPYGAINARVRSALNGAGYRVALWSVDPKDWTRPGGGVVANRILNRVQDGSVVLMHDGGGDRSGTVAAVRTVVPALIERGFELVTMSELVGLAEPPPAEKGTVITVGEHEFRVETEFEDVKVRVNGTEVEMAPPVQIEGHFLLHARPVVQALGAACRWDAGNLSLEVLALRGRFEFKLNSLQMTANGMPTLLVVPSILHQGQAMLPARHIAEICGAQVAYDGRQRTMDFRATMTVELPQAHGGRWV